MFRDPLAPVPQPWSTSVLLRGLDTWQVSARPYTTHVAQSTNLHESDSAHAGLVGQVAALVQASKRGLIVAGGISSHGDMLAVMKLSQWLGWPLVADPLSGVRLRGKPGSGYLIPFMVRLQLFCMCFKAAA